MDDGRIELLEAALRGIGVSIPRGLGGPLPEGMGLNVWESPGVGLDTPAPKGTDREFTTPM